MSYKTIKIKKYSDNIDERDAASAITPGMLIELDSNGKVQAHANAGQNAFPLFALEDELQGNSIDDDYAADNKVQCWIPYRGDEVNAIVADGNTISIGDQLESDGNGYLQAHSADSAGAVEYPNSVVAVALEAVDTSGSSGTESSDSTLGFAKRIRVRVV